MTEETDDTEMPAPVVSPLERKIWEIVKKHQEGRKHVPKKIVMEELSCWCRSKNLPPVSIKEYNQAIYNLTHGYIPDLHCTEIAHQEMGKEIIEYFSWED